jgi:ABC-type glycerol-3-phosphate transport system substrate-binding protein
MRLDRRRLIIGSAAAGTLAPGRNALHSAVMAHTPSAFPVTDSSISGTVRYSVAGSGPRDAELIQEIIDRDFRSKYPNIDLRVEPSPSGGTGDALLTAMVGGDAPDIFDAWTSRALPYISAGQTEDLAPLMERDYTPDALADFFPWVLEAQTLPNGFQWGMPRYVNITVLIYNKDMLEDARLEEPTDDLDHEAYREMLLALTQKQGDRTRVYGGHVPVFSFGRLANKMEAFGAEIVDPKDPTQATFGSEEGQAAAEFYRALMVDERAITDRTFLTTGGGENITGSRANFAASRIATMEEGFYPLALAEAIGDSVRVGMALPPSGPAGRPIQGSADGFAIWSGSQNLEAAWEAVEYMTGQEYQLELARATGLLPVRASLMDQYEQIVLEQAPNLAESNLAIGPRVLSELDPHERPLFADASGNYAVDETVIREVVEPGLDRIYTTGEAEVTFLDELDDQVTERLQSS